MKPALSIVFFTVSSGAGLGLLALLALSDLLLIGNGLSRKQLLIGGGTGFVLVAVGLLASTLHLANPRNAWRSFSRFRTSWLSREAVFAVLFMAATFIYMASVAWQPNPVRTAAAVAVVVLAWVVLYCTAMIYASLKPIRQWHTPLTPLCYLLLGHYSASLLLIWLAGLGNTDTAPYVVLSLVLLLSAAAAKMAWIENAPPDQGPRIQSALGQPTAAQVKLLDAGHTHGTFLTNEFAFRLARTHAHRIDSLFWLGAFALPAIVLALLPDATLGAALVCLAGLFAERWLFFAEARHTVNLYHGAKRA
jgi:DMSO reductase anchor subunit